MNTEKGCQRVISSSRGVGYVDEEEHWLSYKSFDSIASTLKKLTSPQVSLAPRIPRTAESCSNLATLCEVSSVTKRGVKKRKYYVRKRNIGEMSDSKRKSSKTSSRFKGVSWHKRDKVYMARYGVEYGRAKHIGSFKSELKAALAVDLKLREIGRSNSFFNFANDVELSFAQAIVKSLGSPTKYLSLNQSSFDLNGYPSSLEDILQATATKRNDRCINLG